MSFPRYPKYKDSGVEWLGEVPDHWTVLPLKAVASHNDDVLDERTPPETEINYVDIASVERGVGIKRTETMRFSAAPSRARRRVKDGDVVVSTVRTYLRAIARIYEPEDNLIVSTGFAVVRSRGKLIPSYLGYLLSADYFVEQVIARSTGVSYPAINASELVAIHVPLPPKHDQQLIATFLEAETAKVDQLVTEQQRLIELLKKKRQAIIAHAVTKGLNSDAPMKPSGFEWIGDLPAHWKVGRLGYYASVENGSTPRRDRADYWTSGSIPWLSSGEVNQGRITEAGEHITEVALQECSLRVVPAGAIILGLIGQGRTRGLAAALNIDAAISQNMAAVLPDVRVDSRYLLSVFQAMYHSLRELGRGGNQAALNCEIVSSISIPVPPVQEQAAVAVHLEQMESEHDRLVSEIEIGIGLLRERRAALISAAVTGKIDVRGHAVTDAA